MIVISDVQGSLPNETVEELRGTLVVEPELCLAYFEPHPQEGRCLYCSCSLLAGEADVCAPCAKEVA